MIFAKKLISYLMDQHASRQVLSRSNTIVYLFSLPFLLGKAAVFSPNHMFSRELTDDSRTSFISGMLAVLKAIAHLIGFAIIAGWAGHGLVSGKLISGLDNVTPTVAYGAVVLNYLAVYLFRYGWEQLSVGGARLLGYAVDDNYQSPLLARDYADFWRRWNIHFRELVVRIFYFPTALKLHRSGYSRVVTVAVSCVVTFVGHGFFMLWTRGILISHTNSTRWVEVLLGLLIYEVFEALLVTLSLLTQNKKRRQKFGRIGLWFGIVVTFNLRAWLVLLILRHDIDLTGLTALVLKVFSY